MDRTETGIVLRRFGGPEQLVPEQIELGEPGSGELLVRNRAISVNFHDTYVRTGQYRTLALPGIPGIDAAAVVEKIGPDVTEYAPGDRVAYIEPTYGAYSSARMIEQDRVFPIPASLDDEAAAATLLRAATVAMLTSMVPTLLDRRVLVQAAAGGVGQLLVAWARHLGAHVIGTAGSEEKAAVAKAAGADEVILYREEDVAARIAAITDGRGVDVVYDSCGKDTFEGSLNSLDYRGHLVVFGQSSGPIEPIAPSRLADRSLTLSRPILFHYLRGRAAARDLIGRALSALAEGVIAPVPAVTFPLAEAAAAHRLLEARGGPGSLLLIP